MKGIASALHFVKDVSNLIHESSKQKTLFKEMSVSSKEVIALNSICPTRWCMPARATARVLDTYRQVLRLLCETKKDTNACRDVKITSFRAIQAMTRISYLLVSVGLTETY